VIASQLAAQSASDNSKMTTSDTPVLSGRLAALAGGSDRDGPAPPQVVGAQGEFDLQTIHQRPSEKSKITIKDVSVKNQRWGPFFLSGRVRGV
jgi:hypothetical protein